MLLRYNTCLEPLYAIEGRAAGFPQPDGGCFLRTAGGVHAAVDSARLFNPGSAPRRIPYKEWEILLPIADPIDYCFYPGAGVIAFVELRVYVQQPQRQYPHKLTLIYQ